MNIQTYIEGEYYNFIDRFSMAPNTICINPALFMQLKDINRHLVGVESNQALFTYMGMRVIRSHDVGIDEILVSYHDPVKIVV